VLLLSAIAKVLMSVVGMLALAIASKYSHEALTYFAQFLWLYLGCLRVFEEDVTPTIVFNQPE
jgi:putative Mn2+ efflux pump MntP